MVREQIIDAPVKTHSYYSERKGKLLLFDVLMMAISILLFFVAALLLSTVMWIFRTYHEPSIDSIIFNFKVPMQGVNQIYIESYVITALIPALLLTIAFGILVIVLYRKWKQGKAEESMLEHAGHNTLYSNAKAPLLLRLNLPAMFALISSIILCVVLLASCERTGVMDYVESQSSSSDFIESEYVDPDVVDIVFPDKKRNLIYIYLESMESSYYAEKDGGFYEESFAPELESLAKSNISFSNGDKLQGSYAPMGATWTSGSMVAQTAGIPLKIGMGQDTYTPDSQFLPGVTSLGDILEQEGYNQMLMVGSDAAFGGRSNYFSQHGNYEIFDLSTAIERGYMTEEEEVWWGFDDHDLFTYAKQEILNLASQPEPFNFTMLTVDTHNPEGYVCELCEDEFDSQLANVIACSSRQVSEFIEWIQEQEFYDNTTIIFAGDHISTQNSTFTELIASDEPRYLMYTIINPAKDPSKEKDRVFTTLDHFPTTLSALGADIEGNKLGLGTDLFSGEETLAEQYSLNEINDELMKDSSYYREAFL